MASTQYSDEFLTNLKNQLEYQVSSRPEEFDCQFYNRWLDEESLFLRYVRRGRGDSDFTVSFLLQVLRWRKRLAISTLNESSFPQEFYKCGGLHLYGSDREGSVVLHVRLRLYYRFPEVLDWVKLFAVHLMIKADEMAASRGTGWVLLIDFTGCGLANSDLELANFINSTLRDYFPRVQMYVLVHNLPWLLNTVKTVFLGLLPTSLQKRIYFSNDKSISQYIDKSSLPPYMGGTCGQMYPPPIPKGSLTASEMIRQKIIPLNEEEEIRVMKYLEKVYRGLQMDQVKG